MNRGDVFVGVVVGLIVVALASVAIGLSVLRYRECRAHGFSAFYCLSK